MAAPEGPTDKKIITEQEDAAAFQKRLDRARIILAVYYAILPFLLVYLLFKIFPPNPWGTWGSQPISFLSRYLVWTTLEERLILLVVAAGALGSYIHSATSYADYRGNQQFNPSWLLWYILRPLVGVCLALVVYFAMRGGLLSVVLGGAAANDAAKAENMNPFGIGAISGLTGMFSKQAADKLAEVFTTLFKSGGDTNRKDSLVSAPVPVITLITPKVGPAAGNTEVVITGTGFAAEATVSFGDKFATEVKIVNDTQITALTPAGEGAVDVTVINKDGQKAGPFKSFTYTGGPDDPNPASPPNDGASLPTDGASLPTGDDLPDPIDERDDADVSSPSA